MEELDPLVKLWQEKPRRVASMVLGPICGMGDDDDVERLDVVETNRKGVDGAGWDKLARGAALHGKEKEGTGGRASKHVTADKHLMLEETRQYALRGNFESQVGDSVDKMVGGVDMGPKAHSLAHEGEADLLGGDGSIGPLNELSLVGAGAQLSHVSDSIISPVLSQSDDIENESGGGDSQMVRCSQIPSINLLVDLNNVECRRRRRRQLSNLLTLREAAAQDHLSVENVSRDADRDPLDDSISGCRPSDDSIQSDSAIVREVRATMAIGGELGVKFLPQDDVILNSMIEIEAREYFLALERETEG